MSNKVGINAASLNGIVVNQTDSCIACGKTTQYKCDRCGDFYCSIECQRKDWPSHRFICFPMPKLVKVGQDSITKNDVPNNNTQQNHKKSETVQKNADQLPNGSCVCLLAFKFSDRCYVRSTNPSAVAERERILNKIHDFGITSSALTAKPKMGSNALALKDERWCRVQVGSNKDKGFWVFYTDFGIRTIKYMKDLRKITGEIINLPCHIHMVRLKGVTYSNDQKLENNLNQFANKEYKINYFNPDENKGNVQLFRWGTSDLLNALVEELVTRYYDDNKSEVSINAGVPKTRTSGNKRDNENKAVDVVCSSSSTNGKTMEINNASKRHEKEEFQPINEVKKKTDNGFVDVKPQNKKESPVPRQVQMQKPCLVPPFEIVPVNEKDLGSNMLIMDNSFIESGFVGCLLDKYCENLKAVTAFLSEYKSDGQGYKPKAKEYCLAEFENVWYRARVEEIVSDDKFLVVYIDFTNEKEVSSNSIRRYPLSLDFACCTTLCGIDGLPDDISIELKEFLEEELKPFSPLQIDSVRMQDNICYLKSNELLKKLSVKKLI